MKEFFKGVLRLTVALLFVAVIVGSAAWGIYSYSSSRESRRNAALEAPRNWEKLKWGDMEASLLTMWRDGWISYNFQVVGKAKIQKREWILEFIDANGFEVFRHTLYNVSRVVNPQGEVTGFEARGQTLISADEYRRGKKWELSWLD